MATSRRNFMGAGLLVIGWGVGACVHPSAEGPFVPGTVPECRVAPGSGEDEGAASARLPPLMAMADPFDPRLAPSGRSDAESLLFATLHAPFVRIDCLGRLQGGIAAEWRLGPVGSGEVRWVLDLPAPPDGVAGPNPKTPVPNAGVLARALAAPAEGRSGRAGVEVLRVGALETGRLEVVLRQGRAAEEDGARVFTLPSLIPVPPGGGWVDAFTGLRLEPAPRGVWPPGDQGTRGDPDRAPPDSPAGTMLHLVDTREGGGGEEVLARVWVVPGGDPRDLLDAGAQVMITRDAEVRDWAEGRSDVQVVALPRDRVHLLVVPSGGVGGLPEGVTASLAREVVDGGAPDPSWRPGGECTLGPPPPFVQRADAAAPTSRRLVYPAHDAVAGALAARLVALVRPGGPPVLSTLWSDRPLRALPLEPAAFEVALREGGDAGYLVSAPRTPTSPCVQQARLVEGMPWVHRGSMVPLVETGAHLLLRPGAPAVEVDGSGAPRMVFPLRRR